MVSRRAFLGWAGFVAGGLLAHHKPGHQRGPAPTSTTTTTLPPEPAGPGAWPAAWSPTWGA